MANYTRQLVANLGSSKTGLAGSLGYRVLTSDGTTVVSRTTSGVTELAGGGGIYVAVATFSTDWAAGRILWDYPSGTYLAAEEFVSPAAVASAGAADIWGYASRTLTGGATVNVVAPVLATGEVVIVRGDDYKAANGRALSWTSTSWPDLTGASVYLDVKPVTPGAARSLRLTGSVVTPTGTAEVQVDVARTDTASLTPKRYAYNLVAALATSGNVVTLATDTLKLIEQPVAAS